MTKDAELLFEILRDRKVHSVEEIEIRMGKRLNTGRVVELRNEGYIVVSRRAGGKTGYVLAGKIEGNYVVNPKQRKGTMESPIRGYEFHSTEGGPQDGSIVQIVSRAGTEHELADMGPMFRIKFGDGTERVVFASELSPWFPT